MKKNILKMLLLSTLLFNLSSKQVLSSNITELENDNFQRASSQETDIVNIIILPNTLYNEQEIEEINYMIRSLQISKEEEAIKYSKEIKALQDSNAQLKKELELLQQVANDASLKKLQRPAKGVKPVVGVVFYIRSQFGNLLNFDANVSRKGRRLEHIPYDNLTGQDQKFRFEDTGNGYYYIKSMSGNFLNFHGVKHRKMDRVYFLPSNHRWPRDDQQFRFEKTGNGYYYIRSWSGSFLNFHNSSNTKNNNEVYHIPYDNIFLTEDRKFYFTTAE